MVTLAAAGVAHTIWAVAYWMGEVDLRLSNGDTVSALNVLAATLVAGGIAWVAAMFVERRFRKARTAWTLGSCFSLGGSLIGPLGSAANTSATIVLVLMHVAVAAIVILGFRETLRDR